MSRGFTLVELLLSIAILGLIGMGAATMIGVAADAQSTSIDLGETVDGGTLASDQITLELQELRGPTGVGLLSVGTTDAIEFIHRTGRRIRYSISGGDLVRAEAPGGGALGPQRVVARGAVLFQVTYRDAAGSPTSVPSSVRRIEFRLDVRRGAVERSFGGQVFPKAADALGADWRVS